MGKKLTIEDVGNRIREKFPDWEFEVLEYNTSMTPMKVKCLQCGEEKIYKQFSHLLNKQTPCICTSNSSQYKSVQQIQELNNFFNESDEFDLVEWTTMNDKKHKPAVTIYHKPCGQTFTRRTNTFYNNRTCPYCDGTAMPNSYIINNRIKEKGYELLSEYQGLQKPVLIRHNKCGFIWKIKPYRFYDELDGTCPNCNRTISKGERKIMEYLEEHNINFDREHKFDWQSHKMYRYDFFLPNYNLIIEFHGQQHYEEVVLFRDSLKTNQEHDKIKMEEALDNGLNYLIIPYTHYKLVDSILDDWFNDYPKGVDNKLMVIERDTTLL